MATIKDVEKYWQNNPLLSYELVGYNNNLSDFFDKFDRIRREVTKFSISYWEFDSFLGKAILDIGCGPGWITVNYAMEGARVYAIDITLKAVELTKAFLDYKGLKANVQKGNAEDLSFKDDFFDLVVSSGVLHHTPNIKKAFDEAYRVLKPGKRAKITLYRKGILHSKFIFPFVKIIMRVIGIKHPGADLAKEAKNADDFIRRYDGSQNPVGIGKTIQEWIKMLEQTGFQIENYQIHIFPKRFIPLNRLIPDFIYCILDRYFGTMVFFNLIKPNK